jgi:hypothetical protein
MMFWGNARLERRIEVLIRYIARWRRNDMANWEMIKVQIAELKSETVKVLATLEMVRKQLADTLAADSVDQVEIKAAHDALAGVIGDMESAVHADGM